MDACANTMDGWLTALVPRLNASIAIDAATWHLLLPVLGGSAYDTPECRAYVTERLAFYAAERAQLRLLQAYPLVPQRTPEWYALRKNRLTASRTADALGNAPVNTRRRLCLQKAGILPDEGLSPHVSALKWGTMMETIASRIYSALNHGVEVHEFGLMPHPTLTCFGASPDGITEMGRMVEFKCPFSRICKPGFVPESYALQIQGQLAVCGLRECDYLECYLKQQGSLDVYMETCGATAYAPVRFHGVICEFWIADAQTYTYLYSPPDLTSHEAVAWARTASAEAQAANPTWGFVDYTTWAQTELNMVRVNFDPVRWELVAADIQRFWDDVETARANPQDVVMPATRKRRNEETPNATTAQTLVQRPSFIDEEDDDPMTGGGTSPPAIPSRRPKLFIEEDD